MYPKLFVDFNKQGGKRMLNMRQKQAIAKESIIRYRKAQKKEKGSILKEFCATTGYNRIYAARVLRGDYTPTKEKIVNKREVVYDLDVLTALKKIWVIADGICGKRLAPFLSELTDKLIKFKEIRASKTVRRKLARISAATIDRLLKHERSKYKLKGKSTTKPGTLLKHQIPIRTFSDWDENIAGFFEADCVANCGDSTAGEFVNTLNLTDIKTAWMEFEAVLGKAQSRVFAALKNRRLECPIPWRGIDCDGGGEFINAELSRYCADEKLTFTRSRPYKKNDQNYVEQKNYSVIRRVLGYARHDTHTELLIINQILALYRLYVNFFQPVVRLEEKIRTGAKTTRKYKEARTPYQRVLSCPEITEDQKEQLSLVYDKLNPADLKRRIENLRKKLLKTGK